MTEVHKIEITPTTLAKVAQALDYRFKIWGSKYDEDGADLMDTLGILYKELASNHLQAVYGPRATKLAGAPNGQELADALTTLEQFDMLKLLQKDESHLDGGE